MPFYRRSPTGQLLLCRWICQRGPPRCYWNPRLRRTICTPGSGRRRCRLQCTPIYPPRPGPFPPPPFPPPIPPTLTCRQVGGTLLGLTEQQARFRASQSGFSLRVVSRDGNELAVTMDFVPTRINVAVSGGRVTQFRGCN